MNGNWALCSLYRATQLTPDTLIKAAYLIVTIVKLTAVKCVIDICATRWIHTADVKTTQISPLSVILWRSKTVRCNQQTVIGSAVIHSQSCVVRPKQHRIKRHHLPIQTCLLLFQVPSQKYISNYIWLIFQIYPLKVFLQERLWNRLKTFSSVDWAIWYITCFDLYLEMNET